MAFECERIWLGILRSERGFEPGDRSTAGLGAAIFWRLGAGLSLMPEGLEAGRSPQELRDLIAFIRGESAGRPMHSAAGAR